MTAFALMAHSSVQQHPEIVADILGGAEHEVRGDHRSGDFAKRFRDMPSPMLSSFVTSNNIRVALDAFALGVTFGLGTLYVLIVNGAMIGGFSGAFAKSGIAEEFWMTVLPHGALELSAVSIAGGAGLMVGYALWCPGRRTRLRALRDESLLAVQLAAGLIPAFVVAGLFEGFVTPNAALTSEVKVALGLAAAAVFWSYLLVAGRQRP
jgi:uncharacterized membrane protein SpoIIM required for sporulation